MYVQKFIMKRFLVIIGISILVCASAFAQYRMDLQDIKNPQLTYLHMGNPGPAGKEIRVNNLYMEKAGVPQLPVMGEFHFARMDQRYWRETLMKMKASGVNIVSTYVIWVLHEEYEGRQKWGGRYNLREFVELCKELGLKVHLRFGPYCNAEMRNGGLPDWIAHNKNMKARTNDPLYLNYTRYWYQSVYNQVKGLLYKDGGPVIGLQLENEYVTPGLVIPHLMKLKEMAQQIGFDVPMFTMTHWMMSEYPKKEIIPYAGHYLETPWITNGDKENPTTDAEFFTYNRNSDNIGNDLIKSTAKVESLDESTTQSPYFTCEIGVGAPTFYGRRAIITKDLGGETANLRLGCGVNLMGYYMYAGGSNPIAEQYTTERATARINYDYQAPIREFGQMGVAMIETKKYNYFMNDFGSELAPKRAYLPVTNRERKNLQWAVRSDGKSGYVFCSNILHKHDRQDYRGVQFTLNLDNETIKIPSRKVTVKNRSYFFWPFNMNMNGVTLTYATAQPICQLNENGVAQYFFFEDDGIPAEFRFNGSTVSGVQASNGNVKHDKSGWFVSGLKAGKNCQIKVAGKNGSLVCINLLSASESDKLWRFEVGGKKYVGLSDSFVYCDNNEAYISSENAVQSFELFADGKFTHQSYASSPVRREVVAVAVAPFCESLSIRPAQGNIVKHTFDGRGMSKVERAYLRFKSACGTKALLNGKEIATTEYDGYRYADLSKVCTNTMNEFGFQLANSGDAVAAEIEVMLENGTRWLWTTNELWTAADGKTPVVASQVANAPVKYDAREHLGIYKVNLPTGLNPEKATRLCIDVTGNVGNAYIGQQLVHDKLINGADWVIGLNRYSDLIDGNPAMTIRVDGLKTEKTTIYFEKGLIKLADCLQPIMRNISIRDEYVSTLKLR